MLLQGHPGLHREKICVRNRSGVKPIWRPGKYFSFNPTHTHRAIDADPLTNGDSPIASPGDVGQVHTPTHSAPAICATRKRPGTVRRRSFSFKRSQKSQLQCENLVLKRWQPIHFTFLANTKCWTKSNPMLTGLGSGPSAV